MMASAADCGVQKRTRKENEWRRARVRVYKQLREISKDLAKLAEDLDTLPKYNKNPQVSKEQHAYDDEISGVIFEDFRV
jgi:hypothetical protein